MSNKFKLFIASIVAVNLISLPAQSQSQCPYLNYMIGPNNNCINLDALGGQGSKKPSSQTPAMVDDNNGTMKKDSTEAPEEAEKSFEQLELEYAIEQKKNSIELIQENNEQMKQQIEVSCAKLSTLDRRQFCLQQRNTLSPKIEENQERITTLETELQALEKELASLDSNPN